MSKRNKALFGVAGNPPNFWKSGFSKERANSPLWLESIGLDALEIQCTYGVRMPEKRAELFLKNSKKTGIELSIHAPYYVSLGSRDPKKIENSLNELAKAVKLAKKIGSKKVIFHPGGAGDNRHKARERAIKALKHFEEENDLEDVFLFPEVAGKIGQLGSLEDIIRICEEINSAWPCLDLAHLHARNHGSLIRKNDFLEVYNLIVKRLGREVLNHLHVHLYPVTWAKGGELGHKAFGDTIPKPRQLLFLDNKDSKERRYFPRYEPFLELVVEKNLFPTIICEAKDSQDVGARDMKKYYELLLEA